MYVLKDWFQPMSTGLNWSCIRPVQISWGNNNFTHVDWLCTVQSDSMELKVQLPLIQVQKLDQTRP